MALEGRRPLDLLATSQGTRLVEDLLHPALLVPSMVGDEHFALDTRWHPLAAAATRAP